MVFVSHPAGRYEMQGIATSELIGQVENNLCDSSQARLDQQKKMKEIFTDVCDVRRARFSQLYHPGRHPTSARLSLDTG